MVAIAEMHKEEGTGCCGTDKVTVSVIVVCYNQAATVARTLESILRQQTDFPFEIVIGDDCSTDGTTDICRDYALRYPGKVRLLHRERNLGVTTNYFDCIRQARGAWLADCAGDDQWCDDHKLQMQHDWLLSHPDYTCAFTDWISCDPDGSNPHRDQRRPEVVSTETFARREMLMPLLCGEVTPHLCSALYRRDVVMALMQSHPEVMMSESFVCEDTQIMMALNDAGPVAVLPAVTLRYSVGGDTVSHRREAERKLRYHIADVEQLFVLGRHFGCDLSRLKKVLRRRVDYMWSLAWHARWPQGVEMIRTLQRRHGLKGTFKSWLYAIASRQVK